MMPSASARSGCSSMSMISRSHRDSKCAAQIALALAMARTEFGAFPETYRRNRTCTGCISGETMLVGFGMVRSSRDRQP